MKASPVLRHRGGFFYLQSKGNMKIHSMTIRLLNLDVALRFPWLRIQSNTDATLGNSVKSLRE